MNNIIDKTKVGPLIKATIEPFRINITISEEQNWVKNFMDSQGNFPALKPLNNSQQHPDSSINNVCYSKISSSTLFCLQRTNKNQPEIQLDIQLDIQLEIQLEINDSLKIHHRKPTAYFNDLKRKVTPHSILQKLEPKNESTCCCW